MEEKHETQPTAMKMGKSKSKYNEKIDFECASAWDQFTLTRFGVDFDAATETPLTKLITNPDYYNPKTESSPMFAERTLSNGAWLTVVYDELIQESNKVSESDLQNFDHDPFADEKLLSLRVLGNFFIRLANISVVGSTESYDRQRKKQNYLNDGLHF